MARRLAAVLLLSPSALACSRSGEVIVVLDSTMLRESVEVVAFPVAATALGSATGDRSSTRAGSGTFDDSVSRLTARFRAMRDSLNTEVAALEQTDRRTRSYAVRYAEIRRRTLAAEQLRARRDSTRTDAAALRSSVARDAAQPYGSPAPARGEEVDGMQRHPARDSIVALKLAPGEWSIGAATSGSMPKSLTVLTVVRGSSDTVRLALHARTSRPAP